MSNSGRRTGTKDPSYGVRAPDAQGGGRGGSPPPGSTSYYARTRSALIDEIVRVLAEHSIADLEDAGLALSALGGAAEQAAREDLLDALVAAVDTFARRPDELKARCALLLELEHDDPSHAMLAERSPVQQRMAERLADALDAPGIHASTERAGELMSLCDALLMRSAITGAPVQVAPTLSAYIHGLADSASRRA